MAQVPSITNTIYHDLPLCLCLSLGQRRTIPLHGGAFVVHMGYPRTEHNPSEGKPLAHTRIRDLASSYIQGQDSCIRVPGNPHNIPRLDLSSVPFLPDPFHLLSA
jgi:hypothetical protein